MREFCAIIKQIKSHFQTSFFDGRTNKDGYYSCAARKHECHIFVIYIAFSMNSRMSGATAQNKRRKTHKDTSFGEFWGIANIPLTYLVRNGNLLKLMYFLSLLSK